MARPEYTEVQWAGIAAGQDSAEHVLYNVQDLGMDPSDSGATDGRGYFDAIVAEGDWLKESDWKEWAEAFKDARARVLEDNDVDPDEIGKGSGTGDHAMLGVIQERAAEAFEKSNPGAGVAKRLKV